MSISRRDFMVGCSAAIAAMAGARVSALDFSAEPQADGSILVVIFLRGGMDGLNFLAPVDDPHYVAERGPNIRIAETGLQIQNGATKQDWRLHPRANALHELYQDKKVALIHACGLPNGTRSHFEAMDLMERGVVTMEQQNLATGWLSRSLSGKVSRDTILPAVSMTGSMPASLFGLTGAAAIPNVGEIKFNGGKDHREALEYIYRQPASWLHSHGREALENITAIWKQIPRRDEYNVLPYQPSAGVKYPSGDIGFSLQNLARLIKMNLGMRAATVDFGGWDTHQDQEYQFREHVGHLSDALAAFWADLDAYQSRLTVVVMSEFGRRLKENQSRGTDHGHGNVMMVLGKEINGGRMLGDWPGLANEQLDQHADLAITTDYRRVLAEVLAHSMKVNRPEQFFPGMASAKPVGLYA